MRIAKPLVAAVVTASLVCLGSFVQGTQASASSGARVSGGGVVDGSLGTTSQLGFNASSSGGQFLCVMAGRSGGFPFGPWQIVSQMHVQGSVAAGSLSVGATSATFGGAATIHVVGKTASGEVLTVTLTDIPYVSWQTAGGAGVAQHRLSVNLPGLGWVDFGPAPLRAGHINIAN
jgi:hypothetical protein